MSSWNCIKCRKRIWDKNIGYIGGTYQIGTKYVKGGKDYEGKVSVICGFCKSDQEEVI